MTSGVAHRGNYWCRTTRSSSCCGRQRGRLRRRVLAAALSPAAAWIDRRDALAAVVLSALLAGPTFGSLLTEAVGRRAAFLAIGVAMLAAAPFIAIAYRRVAERQPRRVSAVSAADLMSAWHWPLRLRCPGRGCPPGSAWRTTSSRPPHGAARLLGARRSASACAGGAGRLLGRRAGSVEDHVRPARCVARRRGSRGACLAAPSSDACAASSHRRWPTAALVGGAAARRHRCGRTIPSCRSMSFPA